MNRPRVSGLGRVAVALIALLVMLPSPTPHLQAQQTTPERRVILIRGIVPDCPVLSAYNPIPCDPGYLYPSELWARDTFDPLITHLISQRGYSRSDLRYFNYASDWTTNPDHRVAYYGEDTRQHLAVSAQNLEDQIRSWGTENVQYDIIGHSLGGAVAAYWAGWQPDPDILKVVRSIITLDSPVNGMFDPGAASLVQWYLDWGGSAGQDLQDSGKVAIMRQSVNNIDIVTFSNENDEVVPTSSALLDGGCTARFAPCSFLLQSHSPDNHSEIVTDPNNFYRIDRILAWDGPNWLSRNPPASPPVVTQPTPSPVATRPPASVNLIPNPSFESGTSWPTGWLRWEDMTGHRNTPEERMRVGFIFLWERGIAHTGDRSLSFLPLRPPDVDVAPISMRDTIPLRPTRKYRLGFWVKADDPSISGMHVILWSFNRAGGGPGAGITIIPSTLDVVGAVYPFVQRLRPTTDWQEFSRDIDLRPDAERVKVELGFQARIRGKIYVDDLYLIPL